MSIKDNILIIGQSGVGKSTSLRNLDGGRTIILNTERKRLPFPDKEFIRQFPINNYKLRQNDNQEFDYMFKRALSAEAEKTDAIVIESFTAMCEMIMLSATKLFSGFDVFKWYADQVFDVLYQSKNSDKYVVFIAIDEGYEHLPGEIRRRCSLEGRKMEGKIEKEFTIVLYADMIPESEGFKHIFRTNDPRFSCKSPMGMFDPIEPNDVNHIINKIKTYRGEA